MYNTRIHETVKIFPGVKIVGNVEIGQNSSVWYNAVLRGDMEKIKVGKFSNIQDNCVIHTSTDHDVLIEDYVSVGHAAVLHGCTVKRNCIIGMNSTILNNAEIGKNSIVGAGAVVTEGKKFPSRSLVLGMPAKKVRELEKEEIKTLKDHAIRYSKLAVK